MWNPFKSSGREEHYEADLQSTLMELDKFEEETSGHPPFGKCEKCGGFFDPDKLTAAWIISLYQGETDGTSITTKEYCDRCLPSSEYTLQLVYFKVGKKDEIEDTRNFTIENGFLQERNDEGEDIYTTTNFDLLYFDCGCEIQNRGDKKCPDCEKPKK